MTELALSVNGLFIEAAWHGPRPEEAPTLVLLHEGLGSAAMWGGFAERLAARTGYGVLAYSRLGYGHSAQRKLPWPISYMHDEAREVLPAVLDQAGVGKCVLVGHSDGGSIATIYAGSRQDFRVRGLALLAPHFFVEDISIESIRQAKKAFETGDLRAKLARWHDDVGNAFYGWNGAWLNPEFRSWRIDDAVAHVRVPILIVQGADDPYGTEKQMELAVEEAYCPVETLLLPGCGHAPHREAPEVTLEAVAAFAHRVLTLHEGLTPAA